AIYGWWAGWGLEGFFWAQLAARALAFFSLPLLAWLQLRRASPAPAETIHPPPGMWQVVKSGYTQNLGTMATQHLDMLLIGSILSPQAAGVYKLVKNLGSLLRNFTNPLRELAYTTVSQILANDRHFSAV